MNPRSAQARIRRLTIAVMLVLLQVSVSAQKLDSWREYTFNSIDCAAIFPGEPKVTEKTEDDGRLTVTASYGNSRDTEALFVSRIAIAPSVAAAKSADRILDDAIDGSAKESKGTVVKKEQILVQGNPARLVTIEGDNWVGLSRYVLVNKTGLYIALALRTKPSTDENRDFLTRENMERFLRSFTLPGNSGGKK